MNNQKKLENRKKLRYGSTALILTAVVVLAVIVINIVFTKLAYVNNWYVDMTQNKIYGLSDEGRALLDTMDKNAKIAVHFCTPLDKLDDNDYQKMVFELVKQISDEYPNVTYDYIDIVKDASKAYKYKDNSTDTVSADSIIVERTDLVTDEGKSPFVKFSLSQMFIYDPTTYVYWAFDGEKRLVTAMVSVTQTDMPIAYLSTGHGEYTSTTFNTLLSDAGYDVRTIDLTKENFDESARLLVIMNPLYDFQGDPQNDPEIYSEVEKIADWLADKGNLMIFRGGLEHTATAACELPELDAMLAEWGIEFGTAHLTDSANALVTGTSGGLSIIEGKYAEGDTVGAKLVSDYVSLASPPKVVVPYARPINLLYDQKNYRETSAVVYSQSTAVSNSAEGTVRVGETPVMAVSRETRIVNNIEQHNYVYAIGSLGFGDASYLNASYANNDIVYSMMRQMGQAQVPIDLEFKVFEDEALDINIDEATAITWVLVLVIPAAVLAIGLVVHIRRKRA